ncbi:MAG: APC family permease [Thermoplasmata archaeon]
MVEKVEAKISVWQATAIGLGNIIGAGIFVLAGAVIRQSGPGAIVAFAFTAFLAMTVAFNSADLSSKIISHGGLYSFAKVTMGDSIGFIVGWLRGISYAIAGAAVTLGFSSYLLSFFHVQSYLLIIAISVIFLVAITIVDYIGIKLVAKIEEALVIVTALGLVVFVISSFIYGRWTPSRFLPLFPHGPLSIVEAASLAFFAYSGFNTIATLTPEVKDGPRNVPKAIITSLVISTVLYIFVVIGMLAMMPWYLYGNSADPLAQALSFSKAPIAISMVVSAVAVVATFTVTLSLIVAGSRTLLQMSEDGLFPKWIEGKNPDSPKRAVLIIGGLAILSLFLGNLSYVALASNFGVIFSYALSGVAVILIRRRLPAEGFNAPLFPYFPILSVILSLVIMITLGSQALYLGSLMIIAGIIILSIHKRNENPITLRR